MDKNKLAIDVFDSRAKEYASKYMDVSQYKRSAKVFCDELDKINPDILEVACGPGNMTKHLLETRPDLSILATDLSTNMLALAKENNPTATFQLLDSRKIQSLNQSFDGVFSGFCLPYLSQKETIDFIDDTYKILNTQGIIYISTMEGKYAASRLEKSSDGKSEVYVYYHEKRFLIETMEKVGFEIIFSERLPQPTPFGASVNDVVVIGKK